MILNREKKKIYGGSNVNGREIAWDLSIMDSLFEGGMFTGKAFGGWDAVDRVTHARCVDEAAQTHD